MQPSVIIFDFDGTIADTHHYMVEICNQLAPEYGYDTIPQDAIEALRDKSVLELIEHLRIPFIKIPSIVAKAKRIFHDGIADVKLIDGMHDVLHELHRRGVQIGAADPGPCDLRPCLYHLVFQKFLRDHTPGAGQGCQN